jgi:hypothetical protein
MGQTVAVDELERLLRSESMARDLTSSYVITVNCDPSILIEATRQLDRFQSWEGLERGSM